MPAVFTADTDMGAGRFASGARMIATGSISLGTYAAGGVAVDNKTFGLNLPLMDLYVDPAGGYTFSWNKGTGKVMAYQSAAAGNPMSEVGSVDLSAIQARCRAESKG